MFIKIPEDVNEKLVKPRSVTLTLGETLKNKSRGNSLQPAFQGLSILLTIFRIVTSIWQEKFVETAERPPNLRSFLLFEK